MGGGVWKQALAATWPFGGRFNLRYGDGNGIGGRVRAGVAMEIPSAYI